ncbi:MAG: mannose-1-phosphate guanylyltransferase/mannose-6-phosphate isomerase [Proteobacteria bacterium]|nr:mannose-1-phosphate guanylyltransferase/mannose-6-phosphate isomerase [Pseudomonadota bacterium]
MNNVVPVIIAGGAGSRLWPLSRELFPKQFHALFNEHSLLQNTLIRAREATARPPVLVCNQEHRFLVAEQCRAVGVEWQSIILEPEGRSTAPAIALAAHVALAETPGAQLMVLSSDHLIEDTAAFVAAVRTAAISSAGGELVTFGITPTRAETGYGYIRLESTGEGVQPVGGFVEKPDQETAQTYLAAGNYLWNSGMFMLDAATYLDELRCYEPQMAAAVEKSVREGRKDLDFFRPGDAFLSSPSNSIDYAVLEHTRRASVLPVDFAWSDIGSWAAMWEASKQDEQGNYFKGDVVALDTENSYVLAQDRLVGTIGVRDLVIVETADAVLVADKAQVQQVKTIVARLKADKREEYISHREVFRPWGSYESVGQGQRYQVKRIKVHPGASLSLQRHEHRAEHWVVVRGTAEVTRGNETFSLAENESTYIPLGTAHRLRNPGKSLLELVEVQVGAYLGEDDIVRFDDSYGR